MKAVLLATTALTTMAAISSAGAAPLDMSSPAVVLANGWTGFYVGLNAGYAWSRSSANTAVDCSSAAIPPAYFCATGAGAANAASVAANGTGTIAGSGFTGGFQGGYNLQQDNLVYGLETEFGAFSLKAARQGSAAYPVFGPGIGAPNSYTANSSFNAEWLLTLRGRLGVVLPSNLLAYATGGVAMTNLRVSNSFSDNAGAGESATNSKVMPGWIVGAGLEYALTRHWTVKAEYLYVDFGKLTAFGAIANPSAGAGYAQGISTSTDLTAQIARLGFNFKF